MMEESNAYLLVNTSTVHEPSSNYQLSFEHRTSKIRDKCVTHFVCKTMLFLKRLMINTIDSPETLEQLQAVLYLHFFSILLFL